MTSEGLCALLEFKLFSVGESWGKVEVELGRSHQGQLVELYKQKNLIFVL